MEYLTSTSVSLARTSFSNILASFMTQEAVVLLENSTAHQNTPALVKSKCSATKKDEFIRKFFSAYARTFCFLFKAALYVSPLFNVKVDICYFFLRLYHKGPLKSV